MEPEFYGDLVYKFRRIVGGTDLFGIIQKDCQSLQKDYYMTVMQKTACIAFNLIMVDNFASRFECTTMNRVSD